MREPTLVDPEGKFVFYVIYDETDKEIFGFYSTRARARRDFDMWHLAVPHKIRRAKGAVFNS